MKLGSSLSLVSSCCVGLMAGTAAMARERGGWFIPRSGVQFTTHQFRSQYRIFELSRD